MGKPDPPKPRQKITLNYERAGQTHTADIRPDTVEQSDHTLIGRVGLRPQPDRAWDAQIRRSYRPSVIRAFGMGWEKPFPTRGQPSNFSAN